MLLKKKLTSPMVLYKTPSSKEGVPNSVVAYLDQTPIFECHVVRSNILDPMLRSYWLLKWWAMYPPHHISRASKLVGERSHVPNCQCNEELTSYLPPGMLLRRWHRGEIGNKSCAPPPSLSFKVVDVYIYLSRWTHVCVDRNLVGIERALWFPYKVGDMYDLRMKWLRSNT